MSTFEFQPVGENDIKHIQQQEHCTKNFIQVLHTDGVHSAITYASNSNLSSIFDTEKEIFSWKNKNSLETQIKYRESISDQ